MIGRDGAAVDPLFNFRCPEDKIVPRLRVDCIQAGQQFSV